MFNLQSSYEMPVLVACTFDSSPEKVETRESLQFTDQPVILIGSCRPTRDPASKKVVSIPENDILGGPLPSPHTCMHVHRHTHTHTQAHAHTHIQTKNSPFTKEVVFSCSLSFVPCRQCLSHSVLLFPRRTLVSGSRAPWKVTQLPSRPSHAVRHLEMELVFLFSCLSDRDSLLSALLDETPSNCQET